MRFGPCCDGVSTVGGGVRKAGFKGGGGVRLSLSGFWEIAACVNSGVTLKGLRGVENAVVAVEESCVLDVKSGTVLIISSGRVLAFNYSLKARYLFCNWKYRLTFSSSRKSFRESTSPMLPCISCIAGRSGTGERVCCFRYFRSYWGMFSWNPAWLKPSSLGRTFVRSRQLSGAPNENMVQNPLSITLSNIFLVYKR